MASRERRDEEVMDADSQRDACTGMLPYGVEGERGESREVSSVKCFDSSRAIFVKSEKKAGGKSGCFGPKRAMISQARSVAHCSILAKACNMTARFLRLLTFPGSTVVRENDGSRGGISGG